MLTWVRWVWVHPQRRGQDALHTRRRRPPSGSGSGPRLSAKSFLPAIFSTKGRRGAAAPPLAEKNQPNSICRVPLSTTTFLQKHPQSQIFKQDCLFDDVNTMMKCLLCFILTFSNELSVWLFAMVHPHPGSERQVPKSAKAGPGLVIIDDDDDVFLQIYNNNSKASTIPGLQARWPCWPRGWRRSWQ